MTLLVVKCSLKNYLSGHNKTAAYIGLASWRLTQRGISSSLTYHRQSSVIKRYYAVE